MPHKSGKVYKIKGKVVSGKTFHKAKKKKR